MKPAPLALLALLLAVPLAGCADAPAATALRIDYAGRLPTVEATVAADLASRPADSLRAASNAPTTSYYSAFDQLQQWSSEAGVPVEVSHSASFGFFLSRIAGQPAATSEAYWSLAVDGKPSEVGMEQVPVVAGTRVAWTLTPLAPATGGSSSTSLPLEAPARVETKGTVAYVNGTTAPGATLTVRGGPGAPAVQPGGAWSYRIEPAFGRTNLTFTADDGTATRQATVTVVRLASATFEAKYTMAVPPHAATSDLVWYDPGEHASAPLYAEHGAKHPGGATVHDLMVTWTRQTGTPITYSHSASFGFGVEEIDGVGAPLSNGTPPYWCYKLNGAGADLGITLQPVAPGDTVTWEFAGCA